MARTDPVFNLRMPADLKDSLQEEAKKNGRSLNAEIAIRLERSLDPLLEQGSFDEKIRILEDMLKDLKNSHANRKTN